MKISVVLMAIAFALGICSIGEAQEMPEDLPDEAIEDLEEAADLMGEGGPDVGTMAPDFTLLGLNGEEITLANLRGVTPVVLLFGSCT